MTEIIQTISAIVTGVALPFLEQIKTKLGL